jgi:hypothetical protein
MDELVHAPKFRFRRWIGFGSPTYAQIHVWKPKLRNGIGASLKNHDINRAIAKGFELDL